MKKCRDNCIKGEVEWSRICRHRAPSLTASKTHAVCKKLLKGGVQVDFLYEEDPTQPQHNYVLLCAVSSDALNTIRFVSEVCECWVRRQAQPFPLCSCSAAWT